MRGSMRDVVSPVAMTAVLTGVLTGLTTVRSGLVVTVVPRGDGWAVRRVAL